MNLIAPLNLFIASSETSNFSIGELSIISGLRVRVLNRIIKDNTTTLKNYFQKNNIVRLEPANKDFNPIMLESKDVEIIGKVKAVWRMLK